MWFWLAVVAGSLVLLLVLVAVLGAPVAYFIGRVARFFHPPKPIKQRPTYPETPACRAARERCETSEAELQRIKAASEELQRQIDENEKRLKAQRKQLFKRQKK